MKRRLLNILIGFDQFCQVLVYVGNLHKNFGGL